MKDLVEILKVDEKEKKKILLDTYPTMYCSTHTHTEDSLNDGAQSITECVETAKQQGAKALAITNHGTMMGIYEFYSKCKDNGIKPIIGVEAYVSDANLGFPFREHLILLAKDNEGYHAISHAVTESYANTHNGFPIMDIKILHKWFAKGSLGHNHVIATSACVQGPVASEILRDVYYENFWKKHGGIKDNTIVGSYTRAKNKALEYQDLFGMDNFYMEVQYHGLDIEKKSMPELVKIAKEINAPLVAANDAHISRPSEDNFIRRQITQALRYNDSQWHKLTASDKEVYLKTDGELIYALSKILKPEDIVLAMQGIIDISEACNFEDVKSEHYPKFISKTGKNANDALLEMCESGKKKLYRNDWNNELEAKFQKQYNTIKTMGYCDYLCIVQDYITWTNAAGRYDSFEQIKSIFDNDPEKYFDADVLNEYADAHNLIGIGIGPARGSAAGSLVCYLSGITSCIDPIKFNLLPERFLNPDRVSMPDIDVDFRIDLKGPATEYVKYKYGEDAVCCISTKSLQGPKGALRNAARVMGGKEFSEVDMSELSEKEIKELKKKIKDKYIAIGNMLAKEVPDDLGTCFKDCEQQLIKNHSKDPLLLQIIHWAVITENMLTHYSMHAAGVIIADGHPVADYVPLTFDSSNNVWKTMCDMVEAEDRGLLKMDFLGLRNLNIITKTVKLIQQRHGINIDVKNLPFEENVFKAIFQTGFTNSIFQFESPGMKQMLRDFKPSCFEDIILLVAAYRPGPIQYIPAVTKVKKGAKAEYILPEFEEILGVTYGKPIYQEQIMQLFQLAGFSLGEADIIRRYMSKKKTEKFMHYKDQFVDGLLKLGADKTAVESFWTELIEFSKYAFNKSHAAAYAYISYITAYLKYHYPIEYMCGVMCFSPFEKIPSLIQDCRTLGIEVSAPDINLSISDFTIKNDKIIFGLNAIKGVKSGAANIELSRNVEYTSLENFMSRCTSDKRICEALINAGCFDSFNNNRKSTLALYEEYSPLFKRITEKQKKLSDISSSDRVKTNAKLAIDEARQMIASKSYPLLMEDNKSKLEKEYNTLGIYVSGHPLDNYFEIPGTVNFSDLTPGTHRISGIITKVEERYDRFGETMATITVSDKSDEVKILAFANIYNWKRRLLKEGNIISCMIDVSEKKTYDEESGEEKIFQSLVFAKQPNFLTLKERLPEVLLHVKDYAEWLSIQGDLTCYLEESGQGYSLKIWNEMFSEIINTKLVVAKDIENSKFDVKPL